MWKDYAESDKSELYLQDKEDREMDLGPDECDTPFPLTVTSRLLYLLGDITAGPAYKLTQWLELVRKRNARHRSSGFPHHPHRPFDFVPSSGEDALLDDSEARLSCADCTDLSLWERLGKASALNVEAGSFSWDMLSSLYHTEHTSIAENSEDEMSKALEVTVNSGGVVFFSLFNFPGIVDTSAKEAVAVIKISSSRMATQSERLGYEFAKWLGVQTPQARVIHNSSPEWFQIKEAAEKAREAAVRDADEIGETTCTELLEALELSRCLFLMGYVHGSPLLESSEAFASQRASEKTAAALGRILLLDLVIRNEDRLPCRQLRWRGNPANLLYAEKSAFIGTDALEEAYDSAAKHYRPRVIKALQKERRAASIESKMNTRDGTLLTQSSDILDTSGTPKLINMIPRHVVTNNSSSPVDFHIVAIDSVVPRRPPAGKRANDRLNYPKLVELLLNSTEYSSNLLHEITEGKLGLPRKEDGADVNDMSPELTSVVYEFRNGFRAALRDLQGFHIFLLTLHQKLECSLRSYMNIINRSSSVDFDKEELMVPESPLSTVGLHCSSPSREQASNDSAVDVIDVEPQKLGARLSSSASKENSDSSSHTRDYLLNKGGRGSGGSFRMSAKLRDFHKFAKVNSESNKELEQWVEMLRNDAIKLCLDNNFNSGYFEGNDSNIVVDSYELKVRLEHILERITLISEAANTEKPSPITNSLFIGGALAARSIFTLQHLNITHILCLCSNEIGQSDSQHPDLFHYKNFSISDDEDVNISSIFSEACDFIDHVEQIDGKVLVHCFEGRSRSATVVIAYLMLRKNFTLLKAWNTLRRVHRRAQPNDGFAKILLELDRKLHGQVSMEWHQRKPAMKVCPICGKDAGLSSSSLKLHLQKAHKKISSGSVDSAMTMEIQKALAALKVSRSGSVSPTSRRSLQEMD
ncbi:hypothetical protein MLD38_006078 [Melastoma candidum]|uniref:Uncharacterized protein n=1 Tax=Melastoma candidum TaxID=119954 RepID=A0ACB9RQY0_9MYRT|nr:hypothetical protein MLD38_006078 [Melastoma candidum]